MTKKLMTVEEIAEQLVERVWNKKNRGCAYPRKHHWKREFARELLSFAAQEAEPLYEALELANRDIFEWEATAAGLRKLPPDQLNVMIQGTERGEKDSERVRHKIHEALTAHRQKYPKEKS